LFSTTVFVCFFRFYLCYLPRDSTPPLRTPVRAVDNGSGQWVTADDRDNGAGQQGTNNDGHPHPIAVSSCDEKEVEPWQQNHGMGQADTNTDNDGTRGWRPTTRTATAGDREGEENETTMTIMMTATTTTTMTTTTTTTTTTTAITTAPPTAAANNCLQGGNRDESAEGGEDPNDSSRTDAKHDDDDDDDEEHNNEKDKDSDSGSHVPFSPAFCVGRVFFSFSFLIIIVALPPCVLRGHGDFFVPFLFIFKLVSLPIPPPSCA
jgi:hypothetical protein